MIKSMLPLRYGDFEVVVSDQAGHKPGSADNLRRFDRETCLSDDYYLSSHHAVVVSRDDEEIASRLLSSFGFSGIYDHSALIHEDRLILTVGNCLFALEIPTLNLVWKTQVDYGACFGVHLPPSRDCLISHGEQEISRLDFDGQIEWQSSGADIFTGSFGIFENHIDAVDFNGWRYRIDVKTGKTKVI
jgi:hypothetical protein